MEGGYSPSPQPTPMWALDELVMVPSGKQHYSSPLLVLQSPIYRPAGYIGIVASQDLLQDFLIHGRFRRDITSSCRHRQ